MSPIEVDTTKKKCTSWKNSFRITPPPKYRMLLKALTEDEGKERVGNIIKDIVKDYFDKMPPDQKARLLKQSKHHY